MPNRDGTGPAGQGPLTGRGMGPCSRNAAARRRRANPGNGKVSNDARFVTGLGLGRGQRNRGAGRPRRGRGLL